MKQASNRPFSLFLCAVCIAATIASAAASELDKQREAFREAYAEAELGTWSIAPEREALLRQYILWPDLRAAWLKTRLNRDDAAVREFLAQYGDLKPARELRYRYALALGKSRDWDGFLALYRAHYQPLGIARLDCLALQAELDNLEDAEQFGRLRKLWLTGQSQAKECDVVFARARQTGLLDETLHRERFQLSVDARELGMARYLARSLPDAFQLEARRWSRAYGEPRRFLDEHDPALQSETYREQLLAAIKRIAYDDPALARQYWRNIKPAYAFVATAQAEIERHITLWLARNRVSGDYQALLDLPENAVDDEVRRWRVRSALRQHRWSDVLDHIAALPADAQQTPQWQYWLAIAWQQTGDTDAQPLLEAVAADRSYYGFLAADELGRDYAYGHRELPADEATLQKIASIPQFERARELFMVGLDGRGRSEWDAAVRNLSQHEQVQAAILAHRWGWHSRAIATAALNQRYDDLEIRYPLPHATQFETYARAAGVRPSWAFGIARSESLFMPDIRSAAGAIGVMQLMPATGRLTARQIGLPFKGRVTLTDPDNNIRLGTSFLGSMQQRFASHPVLATAAYNAGPLRVEAWLPEGTPLDARIWIETIPYAETRGYVRRVLTADAIFHWRMAGKTSRLTARLTDIPSQARVAAAAID